MLSRPQMKEEVHLVELDGLLATTSRQALRERLQSCRGHIEGVLRARQASLNSSEVATTNQVPQAAAPSDLPPQGTSPSPPQYETIDTYDWIESDEFMKLYLTVADLTADDHDKATCNYPDRGLDLRIHNVKGKNFRLVEEYLAHRVKPEDSRFKVQDGMLVLFLAKADPKITWGVVSTTASMKSALPDHFGRTELKVLLNEYYRIRDSDVCRTPGYPLGASIREFMTSQGFYDVFDVSSAKSALDSFAQSPPKAAVVNFSSVATSAMTKTLLIKLVTAVAATPACKLLLTCPNFIRPDEHPTNVYLLYLIVTGRCELTHFSGRLDLKDVRRLPVTLYKLGVGVANASDAEEVTRITLPKNLQTLGISVSRGVKVEYLRPLPFIKNPYQLYFADVTDEDVDWVIGCLHQMVQNRVCWLHFPNSRLSPAAAMQLLREKLYMEDSFLLQIEKNAFIQITCRPDSPPERKIPIAVYGVLGVAVDAARWTEVERSRLLKGYVKYGCQLKLSVDWGWNNAE